jgi:site-specific DNA-methyltransferase (adenine-specific)
MNNMHTAMLSSKYMSWETPQDFFNALDREFNFTLDPCCTPETAKCRKFYTEQEDGLAQSWAGETVFVNPPYGRELKKWVIKCSKEAATVVMLIPARTDTTYFHEYIYGKAQIRFIKGRLKFKGAGSAGSGSAPFPSMVVVFYGKEEKL